MFSFTKLVFFYILGLYKTFIMSPDSVQTYDSLFTSVQSYHADMACTRTHDFRVCVMVPSAHYCLEKIFVIKN
jgi:hypothetical protein